MSGGANNGAWEAGVVWGLLHYGDPTDYAYDIITGVSAGALNTGMFATWAKGDEYAMSESISDTWASVHHNTDIFTTWDGMWPPTAEYAAKALFTDPSILNSDKAVDFITEAIAPQGAIKRKFVTAAVDANTGEYVNFTQDNCTFEELPICAMASGSIPVVIVPRYFRDMVLIDGGSVWNLNIDAAINQCLDMGYESKDIIIDTAACSYHTPNAQEASHSAFDNWMGSRDIRSYYIGMDAI
jgi:predicted acylesterase/phospholipase RssA